MVGPFTPKDRFFFARRRGNSYENWDYSCIVVRQLFSSSNVRHEIWERRKGKTNCGHYNVVIKLIITLLFLPKSFSLYAIFNFVHLYVKSYSNLFNSVNFVDILERNILVFFFHFILIFYFNLWNLVLFSCITSKHNKMIKHHD